MKRLPPQPTNTSLARLMRRIVDTMPWVMARNLREARADLARVRGLNAHLREENYDLRMDFDELMHGAIIMPAMYASIRIDASRYDPVLILTVDFQRLNAAVTMRRSDLQISQAGAEALNAAAERVARAMVRPLRDAIVKKTLGGKSIDQVLKEKTHG